MRLIPGTGRTVIPLSRELLENHDYLLHMRGKQVCLPIDKASWKAVFEFLKGLLVLGGAACVAGGIVSARKVLTEEM